MFVGQSQHTLDDKLRIVLPAKMRNQLSTTVYLSFDLDHCIAIYAENDYQVKATEMSKLDDFNPEARAVKRVFFSNSFETTVDKQGRISIPKFLLTKASINKDVVIVGSYDRIQIFSREAFETELKEDETNYESLASKVNSLKYGK